MIFYIVIFIDTYFFEGHELTNPAVSGVWTDRTKTFKWDYYFIWSSLQAQTFKNGFQSACFWKQ